MNNIGYPLDEKYRINELILNIEEVFNTHKIVEIKSSFKNKKQEKMFLNTINAYWSINLRHIPLDTNIIYRESLDPKHYPKTDGLLKDIYSLSYNKKYFNLIYNLFSTGIKISNRFEIYKNILIKYDFKENEIDDFIDYLKQKHNEIKKNKKSLTYNKKSSDLSYDQEDLKSKKNYDNNIYKWKQDGIILSELFMKHGLKSISSNNPTFIELIQESDIHFAGISSSFFKLEFNDNISLSKKEKIKNVLFNLIENESHFLQALISTWKDNVYYGSIYSNKSHTAKKMKITKNLLNIYINKNENGYSNQILIMKTPKYRQEIIEHKKTLKELNAKLKDYNWLQEEIETNPNSVTEDVPLNIKKRRM